MYYFTIFISFVNRIMCIKTSHPVHHRNPSIPDIELGKDWTWLYAHCSDGRVSSQVGKGCMKSVHSIPLLQWLFYHCSVHSFTPFHTNTLTAQQEGCVDRLSCIFQNHPHVIVIVRDRSLIMTLGGLAN